MSLKTNIRHYITILLLSLLQCACCDEQYYEYISLTPRSLSISSHGAQVIGDCKLTFEAERPKTQSIEIKSTNVAWSIENPAAWVKLSATSGTQEQTVTVTVDTNPSVESRVAVLKLVSNEKELPVMRYISVTQLGQLPYITLGEEQITMSGTGGSQIITVNTNLKQWNVTATDNWITVEKVGDNQLKITVDENTGTERNGTVEVKQGDGEPQARATLRVTQYEAGVTPVTGLDEYAVDGGVQTFNFNAEASWTARTTYSWIDIKQTSGGAGENVVTVEVTRNTLPTRRSGSVYIYVGSKQKLRVDVSQAGVEVQVTPTQLAFESEGGKLTFQVQSNTAWTLDTQCDWMTLTPTQGAAGRTTVEVAVGNVGNTSGRVGSINVYLAGNSTVMATVDVTQEGQYINISCDEAVQVSTPCSVQVTVGSNTSWTATTNVDWMTVTPTQGEGDAELTVTFEDNPSAQPRTGYVVFESGDMNKSLSFTQPGKYLTLGTSAVSFFASGGDAEPITVQTDGVASVTAVDSWLTARLQDGKLFITAAENTSYEPRTGAVTITLQGLTDSEPLRRTVTVTQSAKSAPSLTFTVKGVNFTMIPVAGGTFQMGATDEQVNCGYDIGGDESPVHNVTLSDYYIGMTEVTQALWYAVMGERPSSGYSWTSMYGLGDDYPAYYICYDDCQEFIIKLNTLTGASFRMLTEAEWEYAARGGSKSMGYIFSGSNALSVVAWNYNNSYIRGSYSSDYGSHKVATLQPNELGLYDMTGNVSEWCSDLYDSYSSASQTNPTGSATGSYRVFRGGCWISGQADSRVSRRYCLIPDEHANFMGLRLAL